MRSSSPFGAKTRMQYRQAPLEDLSSNCWYKLKLISSRAEKELARSVDIALAVSD